MGTVRSGTFHLGEGAGGCRGRGRGCRGKGLPLLLLAPGGLASDLVQVTAGLQCRGQQEEQQGGQHQEEQQEDQQEEEQQEEEQEEEE